MDTTKPAAKEARKKSGVVASQGVTLRDFLVFQVKLALEGFKDFLAINLSIVAIIIDLLTGRGRRPRRFYSIVRMSQTFDRWLNLHNMKAMKGAETEQREGSGDSEASSATDADTWIHQFEERVRREEGIPDKRKQRGEDTEL